MTETTIYSSFITDWLPITIVSVTVAIIVLVGILVFRVLKQK